MSPSEFSRLSFEQQIANLQKLGEAALREFEIQARTIRVLNHAENTTYFVESPQGQFNLRISRPAYQSTSNIRSELLFLDALAEAGFSVPKPWQARLVTAEHPDVPEPRDCVLLGWQPGEFIKGAYSPAQARELGRTMARLHQFATSWAFPDGFDRQPYFDYFDRVTEVSPDLRQEDFDLVRQVIMEAREVREALPKTGRSWGLIHADLHHGNVLFDGDTLHLIDFDDCHFDFWLYDLSAAMAYLLVYPEYEEVRDAILDGYSSLRELPSEIHLLDDFLRFRLAQIASWALSRTDNPRFRETAHTWVENLCARIRKLESR